MVEKELKDPDGRIYKSVLRNVRKGYVEPQGTTVDVILAKTPEEIARGILEKRGISYGTRF